MKTPTISELIKSHRDKLGIHFSGDEAEQIGSLFNRYHEIATEALREQKQFNDDLATYLRALVLVLDMTANASTHGEKNARLRGAIELLESAIGKVRDHQFGIAFCSRRFSSDVFRSDYPTRQFVDRIHQLEQELEQTKALAAAAAPAEEVITSAST